MKEYSEKDAAAFIQAGQEAERDPEAIAMEAEITGELTALPALYAFVEQMRILLAKMDNTARLEMGYGNTGMTSGEIIDRCFKRATRAHARIVSAVLRDRLQILEASLKALERKNNAR